MSPGCLTLEGSLAGMRLLHPCAAPGAAPAFSTDTCCGVHGQLGVFIWKRAQCQSPVCSSRMMRTVGREGSDVLSSTRSLWQWKCQSPPTSHNLRANTLLVISKVRGHMITICTELSCRNPHPCQPSAAVLALGMAQEQGWDRPCVSGASSRVPWGPRLCLETELPRMALVGKLSPCGQVPCVSWLLALGAGKDGGTALGHCWPGLAALRCSCSLWGCFCPKRRKVCWQHQDGSEGQSCAQLAVEFLLLAACILSRLGLHSPPSLLQVLPSSKAEMLNDIFVVSCGRSGMLCPAEALWSVTACLLQP